MKDLQASMVLGAVKALMNEMVFGAEAKGPAWVINPGEAGILGSLSVLSASQASRAAIPGRSSAAGHANHVRYHLDLLVRASHGENSFATADWPGSWKKQTVTEEQWSTLVADLQAKTREYVGRLDVEQEWDSISLTGTLASAAHMAYHLGALRQLIGVLSAGEYR